MRADWTAADERQVRERYPDMVPCPPPALHASIELLGKRCTVTDLSHEIAPSNPTFKGHQRTVMWQHLSHEDVQQFGLTEPPYSYEVVAFTLCGHTSTHCDSISHIVPEQGARPIDRSPLQWHIAPGIWLDFRSKEPNSYITRADLERQIAEHGLEIRQGSVLLYATGWSDKWSGDPYAYIEGYPGLDEQASHFLADSGVVAFGADAPSVDSHHEVAVRRVQPAHMMCRERGILNMENLANVHRIPKRSFTFIGLPLKIRNGAGSPIRAVAITED